MKMPYTMSWPAAQHHLSTDESLTGWPKSDRGRSCPQWEDLVAALLFLFRFTFCREEVFLREGQIPHPSISLESPNQPQPVTELLIELGHPGSFVLRWTLPPKRPNTSCRWFGDQVCVFGRSPTGGPCIGGFSIPHTSRKEPEPELVVEVAFAVENHT